MKIISRLLAAGVLSGATSVAGPPTFDQALDRVRRNVATFENQLPDFVCREKITSRTIVEKDGTVEKEARIESVFSARQNRSLGSELGGASFKEDRRIETVNGVAWREKSRPKGVFLVGGGYSSLAAMLFGPKGEANYSFSPAPSAAGGPDGAVVIAFRSTNDKQKIKGKDGVHSFAATGRAWFDPASFEVIRLEESIVPKGDESGELKISVEYQPIRIGDGEFRLPVRVSATTHRVTAGVVERGEYVADYSGYRKYGSTSTVKYGDAEK